MMSDTQLNELLSDINRLSGELDACRKEIQLLKAEIETLKHKPLIATPVSSKPSAPKSEAQTFENFIGLKVIHFVGIIVLLIGLAIGVKYAIDINLISPTFRIIIAYLAGCALYFISLRFKKKYTLFSMVLFSGAMASIYFTTYAAFAYYDMLSRTITFFLMLLFTILTAFNSLKYNKQEIAILGLVGAYGIPFFVRGNEDNLLGLFSYMFIINTGILFLSLKKYWQSLTYLSFFTTWIIFFASLSLNQRGTLLNTQLAFSILFFVLFMVVGAGFKIYKRFDINSSDTIILISNTLALYSSLMILFSNKGSTFLSNITLGFAILHLLAGMVAKATLTRQRNLYNTYFSISLLSIVIFFQLQYTGLTVTIIWGLLAVTCFISGMWWKLKMFRVGAIVLFVGTLAKLVAIDSLDFSAVEKIIAYLFTGTILLVVSFLYQKFKTRIFDEPDATNTSL